MGLNETVGLQLLERPELGEAAAAHYAARSLFSLIGHALEAHGQPTSDDWQRFADALSTHRPSAS